MIRLSWRCEPFLLVDPKSQAARYYLTLVSEAEAVNRQTKPSGYYLTIPPQPIYK